VTLWRSNPFAENMEDYGSAISAYLSLKEATSLCHHPAVVGQQKVTCTEEVELA